MSVNTTIIVLKNEIRTSISVLHKIEIFYHDFMNHRFQRPNPDSAIILSNIFENYYTCLETIFIRVSKFFENRLSSDKWHRELLQKMALRIDEIREPVIANTTYQLLDEFLRFRHFKRYYFELDYDWDKLDFLNKKFISLLPRIKDDLNRFVYFLDQLS